MHRIVIILTTIIFSLSALTTTVHALTTNEIILLKQNGVSDETIQLMIKSKTEENRRTESSIRITGDKSSTTYATGKPSSTPLTIKEEQNMDKAWEMLKNMTLELEN
jgi:hypothetical protein